jgi:hypothetical protein
LRLFVGSCTIPSKDSEMRTFYNIGLLTSLIAIRSLTGCSAANPSEDDSGSDTCSLKREACLNSCYKADPWPRLYYMLQDQRPVLPYRREL